MGRIDDALLRSERTRAAIEKYCAVTNLTVQLHGADGDRILGPVGSTPLFELFSVGGRDPDIVVECLRRLRREEDGVIVVDHHGLAAVGTVFCLDGKAVCAAVGGPILIAHLPHRETRLLASAHGLSDDAVWGAARRELPVSRQRLALYGELLQVVGETLVVEHHRSQQFEAARVEAESANRLKDEFLAVVSHELRNPLNAILGWTRLLGGHHLGPERARYAVGTIERNAKGLARIIDDLLDVSRIVGGGVRIDPAPVDLVAVVQGALDEIYPSAEAKAVKARLTCQAAPDPVAGDTVRLQQVVANLLSNAVKFTPTGGHVEIRLGQVGSEAEIQVSDTGQGIDAAFLPHIFERFTQADASTTRRQGGLGLGLTIVRALVERHGGTVRAESPGPGRGATFTVRLPVLSGHEASDAETPGGLAGATAPASRAQLDGIRVVLVEDNDDERHLLTVMLEIAGAKVAPAASVREAVAIVETIRPDVIVSDIGMPDEDGYALLRRVRAREAQIGGDAIPAIALTGHAAPEDRARLLAAGFQMHLLKPAEPDEIISAVASLTAIGR
jgi:signal transduction histidine kinase/CheY-like chemotaxis protein